jgi:hypothetical protein
MSDRRSVLRTGKFREVEQDRLVSLVIRWLEVERRRGPFRVLERETRNRIELGGLPLVVRADRVDELEDGSKVVIDYKTRPSFISAWDGARPAEPQLPIYATHLEAGGEVVSGVFFAIVRKGDEAFRGVTVSDEVVPGVAPRSDDPPFDERIAEWRHALEGLGEEFRQGLAVVDPRDGLATCKRCNLSAFCRVQDTVGGPSAPSDDAIRVSVDRGSGEQR